MEKDIYSLLNRVDAHADDYQAEALSQRERDAIKARVFAKKAGKKQHWKVPAVAAVALLFALGGILFTNQGYAVARGVINEFTIPWEDSLRTKADLSPYTEEVNTVLPLGEAQVKLDRLILEKDRMTYHLLIQLPEGETLRRTNIPFVIIDGKKHRVMGKGGGMGLYDAGSNTYFEEMILHIKDEIPAEKDVQITFPVTGIETDQGGYSEKALFQFTTSGEQLMADSRVIIKDKTISDYEGNKLMIDQLALNPVGPRMVLRVPLIDGDKNYTYEARGKDDLGREIIFGVRKAEAEGKGQAKVLKVEMDYEEPMEEANKGRMLSEVTSDDFIANSHSYTFRIHRKEMKSGQYEVPPAITDEITVSW